MAVYIDRLQLHPWRGRQVLWCHLIADTVEELHAFAAKVGCKRSWFEEDAKEPHYNLQRRLRARAVALGARECSRPEFVAALRRARAARAQGP